MATPDLLDAVEPKEQTALVATDSLVGMFERLATNKDVDVAKLERLILMQERILARNAETAFNIAFSDLLEDIPEIDEKGQILAKGGGVQSRYAKNEDIQKVIKPILRRHGFTLGFKTEWPDHKTVKVVGILTHREGHARNSEFLSEADPSGSKNAIQGLGSAISYGHRYTTIDLLNITSRDQDDDGHKAGRRDVPKEPEGFSDWLVDLTAVADEGEEKLRATWAKSKTAFREYLTKTDPQTWMKLKAKSAKAKTS